MTGLNKSPDRATIVKLRKGRHTFAEIGARFGVSGPAIYHALHKEARRKRKRKRVLPLPVPLWVPRDLCPQYRRLAKIYGEEHAASWARAKKREVSGDWKTFGEIADSIMERMAAR